MTVLWGFEEKHPKIVSAYGGAQEEEDPVQKASLHPVRYESSGHVELWVHRFPPRNRVRLQAYCQSSFLLLTVK